MSRRPKDYWTLENVVIELNEFIALYPEFRKDSSPKFLEEKGRIKLKRAIYKHHGLVNYISKNGGYYRIRELTGLFLSTTGSDNFESSSRIDQ